MLIVEYLRIVAIANAARVLVELRIANRITVFASRFALVLVSELNASLINVSRLESHRVAVLDFRLNRIIVAIPRAALVFVLDFRLNPINVRSIKLALVLVESFRDNPISVSNDIFALLLVNDLQTRYVTITFNSRLALVSVRDLKASLIFVSKTKDALVFDTLLHSELTEVSIESIARVLVEDLKLSVSGTTSPSK